MVLPDGMVRLDPPVQVEVYAAGEWRPGWADAYRGERVSVRWKGPEGRHVTWEPAQHVRRVTPPSSAPGA